MKKKSIYLLKRTKKILVPLGLLAFFTFISLNSFSQTLSFEIDTNLISPHQVLSIENTSNNIPQHISFLWEFENGTVYTHELFGLEIDSIVDDSSTVTVLINPFDSLMNDSSFRIKLSAIDSNGVVLSITSFSIFLEMYSSESPHSRACHDAAQVPGDCNWNLICNGDFEWHSGCPVGVSEIYKAEPWLGQSCDYYHTCGSTGFFSIPNSIHGYEPTYNGQAYVGHYGLNNANNLNPYNQPGETFHGEVKSTLYQGQRYNVKFYASRSEFDSPYVANIPNANRYAINYDAIIHFGLPATNPYPSMWNMFSYVASNLQNVIEMDPVNSVDPVYTIPISGWTEHQGSWLCPITGSDPRIFIGRLFAGPGHLKDLFPGAPQYAGQTCYYYVDQVSMTAAPPIAAIDVKKNCNGYTLTSIDEESVAQRIWKIGTQVIGNINQQAVNVNVTTTTTVTLEVTNFHGCVETFTVTLDPNCINLPTTTYEYTNATASDILADFGWVQPIVTTNDIYIYGTLTINTDIFFSNCPNIKMGEEAKIIVEPGVEFKAVATNIEACDLGCHLWDGIYANDPTASIIIDDNCYIRHARSAVNASNNANLLIRGSFFNHNIIGVKISDHKRYCGPTPPGGTPPTPINSNVIIENNNFYGDLAQTNIYNHMPNFDGMEWGIYINNVDLLAIGAENSFNGLSCGIFMNESNVTVDNCHFNYIVHHSNNQNTNCPYGYSLPNAPESFHKEGAIVATKILYNGDVAPPPSDYCVPSIVSINGSEFHNCRIGVYAFHYDTELIENKYFHTQFNSFYGVDLSRLEMDLNEVTYSYLGLLHTTNNLYNYEFYIAQSFQNWSHGHDFTITNNTINTFKNGINLINATSAGSSQGANNKVNVNENSIFFANTTSNPTLQGIRVQACDRSTIYKNIVKNNDALNYPTQSNAMDNFHGIHVAQTADATVKDNITEDLGKGIYNIGYNLGTKFTCNSYFDNYDGFYGSPTMSGSATFISDQLSTQASNQNCFDNMVSSRINNLSSGFRWYYVGALNASNCFAPINSTGITALIGTTPPRAFCTLDQISLLDPSIRDELYLGIASGLDTAYAGLQDEFEFYGDAYLYNLLRNDTTWMNLGTVEDSIYRNFYNYFENSTIAELSEIQDLIENHDYEQALYDNQGIVTQTIIEVNQQLVNDIYLNSWAISKEIDPADRATLKSIALLTPYVGGNAVYTARVMLGLDPFNSGLPYKMSNPNQEDDGLSILLYPNPTNGQVIIEIDRYLDNEVLEFSIFNMKGQKIFTTSKTFSGMQAEFDLSKLTPGVYIYKVSIEGKSNQNGRLVIME